MNQRPQRRQRGFTLVESCVATSVVAVVLGTVAPSFTGATERRTIEGLAAGLETDIQFARSHVAAQSQTLRLSFHTTAAGSCYVLHTGAAEDCECNAEGQAQCVAGVEVLKTVFAPADRGVHLKSNVRSMLFDASRGTVTPAGTVRVVGRTGRELRQIVNIMGRVRSCSPSMSGYRAC